MPLFSESDVFLRMPRDGGCHPQVAGVIRRVLPGGAAERAGVRPGDLLVEVNGHPVEDVIDVRFHAAEDECVLTLLRDGARLTVELDKGIDDPIGVEFEDDLFDGIRLCSNRCDFCFVDQQPKGMRPTLQIRDDDYRLSFLHGNFVTLTNLTERDWERIFRQRLSPLYVSVHATDDAVRRRLLRNKRCSPVMDDLRRLIEGGIRLHTQVVLCAGLNDGDVLDRTIQDLATLYPAVETLAVVPMGVTDYRLERNESEPYDAAGARRVLRQVRTHQRIFERELGVRFVHPSDEFYLLAGRPLPRAHTYQGFPQLSNGVGGSRLFLDELRALRGFRQPCGHGASVQMVTGALAAPLVEQFAALAEEALDIRASVLPVRNNWFGHTVTVAGLLTGRDVKDAILAAGRADVAIIPDVMLRDDSDVFLDDMTVEQISWETGRPVLPVSVWPGDALRSLARWLSA
ncbi:MAG: DUF512 domain-containing protein [Armatimonadota bacterium]